MNRDQIKLYIFIFSGIFVCLLFITWQQISIFRLGYRITNLKTSIRTEEIKNQQILENYQAKADLFTIEKKARETFNMTDPGFNKCSVIKIDKNRLFAGRHKKQRSVLSYLNNIFSARDAQAR
jgi:hypothetical protein